MEKQYNKPTPKQIFWRSLAAIGIATTLFSCKKNEAQYPITGQYNGSSLTGRVDYNSANPQRCTVATRSQVEIPGDVFNNQGVQTTLVNTETGPCWVQATLRRIVKNTN